MDGSILWLVHLNEVTLKDKGKTEYNKANLRDLKAATGL